MKRRLLLTFFLLGTTSALLAAPVPLPKDIFFIDDFIEVFRGSFRTKISELNSNYIPYLNNGMISLTSSENVRCKHQSYSPGTPLSKLHFSSRLKGKSLIETATYWGCNEAINLREVVITNGENLKPIPFQQFKNGVRKLDIQSPDIKSRYYQITNEHNEELFSLYILKNKLSKSAEFKVAGQKFYTINTNYLPNQTNLTYTFFGHTLTYSVGGSTWKSVNEYGVWSIQVVAKRDREPEYFDPGRNLISLKRFQDYFGWGTAQPSRSLADFIKKHNTFFPKTEFTSVGGGDNKRILTELQQIFTRLLNGTELNLVRNKIQEYIKAINEGKLKISDNRPRE